MHILSRLFARQGLPIQRVLSREGLWTVQGFIEGKSLTEMFGQGRLPPNVIDELARTLAAMHTTTSRKELSTRTWGSMKRDVAKRLTQLTGRQVISLGEGARLARFFWRYWPKKPTQVPSLFDISRNNTIIQPDGKIGLIDLGEMRMIFREYDLGRTLFKLRLTPNEQKQFLMGYRAAGGKTSEFEENKTFWNALILFQRIATLDHRCRKKKMTDAERVRTRNEVHELRRTLATATKRTGVAETFFPALAPPRVRIICPSSGGNLIQCCAVANTEDAWTPESFRWQSKTCWARKPARA